MRNGEFSLFLQQHAIKILFIVHLNPQKTFTEKGENVETGNIALF
ncbi:hypothetical protein Cabys_1648 [Caldithrix abyssi DSM 13497]|uniref:Uncharacterized protein n=1 Tax=Caldithrix abyssi DSM 13497 TaxID=880073 RepID=A0A1J1C6S6_CALAY|nr:hypothetical protein Cabys_1648 [Caldithrix abyssi DSM 13497]